MGYVNNPFIILAFLSLTSDHYLTVNTQLIKKGRAVHRVRFNVHKVDERRAIEEAMRDGLLPKAVTYQRPERVSPLSNPIHLSTTDYEKAKVAAPGWDIYELERQWREWITNKERPKNPGAAFIAFCKKKHIRQGIP